MKLFKVTLDLAYEDNAEDAPTNRKALENLIVEALDPTLGSYMASTLGVVMKQVNYPDLPFKDATEGDYDANMETMAKWHAEAMRQLNAMDSDQSSASSEPWDVVRRRRKKA